MDLVAEPTLLYVKTKGVRVTADISEKLVGLHCESGTRGNHTFCIVDKEIFTLPFTIKDLKL
jgi:hypothetical protein